MPQDGTAADSGDGQQETKRQRVDAFWALSGSLSFPNLFVYYESMW